MSLGIVLKGTEGVVLAADSRITVSAKRQLPNGEVQPFTVNYDNAKKLIGFPNTKHRYVGAITYGHALIGNRPAHSFIPEIEINLPDERVKVEEYAKILSDFYLKQWQKSDLPNDVPAGNGMTFAVAGYNKGEAYGRVYGFSIPDRPQPEEHSKKEFGITWGGERQIVDRLIKGMDPGLPGVLHDVADLDHEQIQKITRAVRDNLSYTFVYEVLPLQDCIDLALLLIRTTIDFQNLAIGVRGVGGMIDAATITQKDGLRYIQRKELQGERRYRDHGTSS